MYSKITGIRKVLKLIYQYMFMILLFDFIRVLFQKDLLDPKALLILGVIHLISFLVRDFCVNGIPLFILHLVMGVIVFFIVPDVFVKVLLLMAVVEIFLDNLFYINRGYMLKRLFEAPWEVFLLGITASLLAIYMKQHTFFIMSYVITISLYINYMIGMYLEGLERYVVTNRNISGIPMKQIVSVNSVMVSGIMLFIVIMVGLSDILGFPDIVAGFFKSVAMLLKIVFLFLGVLLNLFFGFFGLDIVPADKNVQKINEITQNNNIIVMIIEFIMMLALTAFVLYVVYGVVKFFIKLILKRQNLKYDLTEDLKDLNKKKVEVKESTRKEPLFGRLTPEGRIRDLYKKKVLSYRKYFLPDKGDTTGDIRKAMLRATSESTEAEAEKIKNLTELYNKVRYSDITPGKTEVKQMSKYTK